MADLDPNVVVGMEGHAVLHRDERDEVNRIRARVASLEAGQSLAIQGNLPSEGDLPPADSVPEHTAYLIDGHLWVSDGETWTDNGNIQGPKGDKGDTGATGAQGIQGETGATGAQGVPGPDGPTGAQGPKGDVGAGLVIKGTKANAAALPSSGNTTGDAWLTVDTQHLWVWNGSVWIDGGPVAQGPKGDKGDQGVQGATGAQGPQGIQGVPGPQGIQGVAGPTGPAGTHTTDAGDIVTGTLASARLPDLSATYASAAAVAGKQDKGALWLLVTEQTGATDMDKWEAAIVKVKAAGGGTIVFPPRAAPYQVTRTMVFCSNLTVVAYGATLKRINQVSFARSIEATDTTTGAYNGNHDITILGGTWDSNANGFSPASLANCFTFRHGKRATIRDAMFLNVGGGHAIEFAGWYGALVDNCQFRGFYDTGGRSFAEAIQLDVTYDASLGLADDTACQFIIIRDSFFGASDVLGAWNRGVGSHSSRPSTWAAGITIAGCTFVTLSYAIRVMSWADVLIQGNRIYGSDSYGIRIQGGDPDGVGNGTAQALRVQVRDNQIRDTGSTAIFCEADALAQGVDELSIQGNMIYNPGNHGIALKYAGDALIQGNWVYSAGGAGIQVARTTGTLIQNNKISGAVTNGIIVLDTDRALIQGNFLDLLATGSANSQGGIRTSTAAFSVIFGNTVRKGGSGTYAISINADSSNTSFWGNDLRGFGSGGIYNGSGSTVTNAGNLT